MRIQHMGMAMASMTHPWVGRGMHRWASEIPDTPLARFPLGEFENLFQIFSSFFLDCVNSDAPESTCWLDQHVKKDKSSQVRTAVTRKAFACCSIVSAAALPGVQTGETNCFSIANASLHNCSIGWQSDSLQHRRTLCNPLRHANKSMPWTSRLSGAHRFCSSQSFLVAAARVSSSELLAQVYCSS